MADMGRIAEDVRAAVRDELAAFLTEAGATFEAGRVDTALLVRGDEALALKAVEGGLARVQDATNVGERVDSRIEIRETG